MIGLQVQLLQLNMSSAYRQLITGLIDLNKIQQKTYDARFKSIEKQLDLKKELIIRPRKTPAD